MSAQASTEPLRPLRIAHVITRLINGGADENTVLSCNHAAQRGHHVVLIHGAETRPQILAKVDPRVSVFGVSSLVRPIVPLSDMRAFRDLARIFRRFGTEVVHTHTSKAGVLGRLAARAAKVSVVVHGTHIVPFMNVGKLEALAYLSAERAVQGMTHAFIDVSLGMRDLCLEAGIGSPERHHVIQSGFELSRFRTASPPDDWRELLRLRPDEPRPAVVLMLAVFEARKRHLEFLEHVPRIVAAFPDVRLIFAGDGELRAVVEARIKTLGIERNVILTGFHEHPEQLISLADVCIMASAREGLPRVIMQYLAGGKPVVASNLPGIGDVLRDDVNGLVAPSHDLNALADAVVALLADDGRRARLGRGAVATELSNWEAARMGERIEAVYAGVIRERQRVPGARGSR